MVAEVVDFENQVENSIPDIPGAVGVLVRRASSGTTVKYLLDQIRNGFQVVLVVAVHK